MSCKNKFINTFSFSFFHICHRLHMSLCGTVIKMIPNLKNKWSQVLYKMFWSYRVSAEHWHHNSNFFPTYFTKSMFKKRTGSSVAADWPLRLMTSVKELHKGTSISSYSIYYSCTFAHMQTLKSFFIHHTSPHHTIVNGSNQHQDTSL